MGRVDFAAASKAAEKAGYISQGGDYFKTKEGPNRIRIVSDFLPHRGAYNGTPNFKWIGYVLDRADGEVKVYFMPNIIHKQIGAWQQDPEYAFESAPMPYDIQITAKNAGTKEVEYFLLPAKKNTPLTADEESKIAAKNPIEEVQAAIYLKNGETTAPAHFDPEAVPF